MLLGELRNKVNTWVGECLADYSSNVRGNKVIHDTILGTNQFYQHEISVIDSPILQRLRRISQVDVVSLVWPSSNHNRFEHSLGVATIGHKFVAALNSKGIIPDKEYKQCIYNIRMAGILHDTGHGPFSHMSEAIFKHCEDMRKEIEEDHKLKATAPNPHEVLSYLIVTSEAFKEFYEQEINKKYEVELDLEFIGDSIIGYINDPERAFLFDIINGAFDADKLDYIQRDSHFTGLQLMLDLDRLFYTLDTVPVHVNIRERKEMKLTVDVSGVSSLEQIVFDKMMLQTTVYNHHKVRAAEGLFHTIFFEALQTQGIIPGKNFESAADFLYITDDDILSLGSSGGKPGSIYADSLLKRRLPKRALMISTRSITEDTRQNMWKFMSLENKPQEVIALREKIAKEAAKTQPDIKPSDIWVDVPRVAKFKEGDQWPIKIEGEPLGYLTLREFFPIDQWVKAFSENKWVAHVFTWECFRESVNRASKKIIEAEYGIQLNEFATIGCKFK